MSTYSDPSRRAHLTSLHLQWHDSTIKDALTYLGFPVFFCRKQSTIFWKRLAKIKAGTISLILSIPAFSHPPFPTPLFWPCIF